MVRTLFCIIAALLLATSCTPRLTARVEGFEGSHFASAHVGTPDPLALRLPCSQRLIAMWNLPHCYHNQFLWLKVVYLVEGPIEREQWLRIYSAYGFAEFTEPHAKILTCALWIFDDAGNEVAAYSQKGWVPLLRF